MQAYIIRRVLLIIPTIFVMSLIVFFAIRLIPGDVVSQMASGLGNMSEMTKEEVRKRLGLDAPIPVQYGRWIGVIRDQHGSFSGLFQGSLGLSLWSQQPVTGIVLRRLPVTFELALFSMTLAVLIALPIGVYSAIRQDTPGDYTARSFSMFAIAMPDFWLGTLVIVFPSIWWGWTPPIEYTSLHQDRVVKGTQGEGGYPPACASQRPHSGDHRHRIYVTVGDWGFHYHREDIRLTRPGSFNDRGRYR